MQRKEEALQALAKAAKEVAQHLGELARKVEGLTLEVRELKEEIKRGRRGREDEQEDEEGGERTKGRGEEKKGGTRAAIETEKGEGGGSPGLGTRKDEKKEEEEGESQERNRKKEEEENEGQEGSKKRGQDEKGVEEEERKREAECRRAEEKRKETPDEEDEGRQEEEREKKRRRWEEELGEREKRKKNVLLRGKMDVDKMGIGRTEEIIGLALGKEVRIRRIVERMKRGEEGSMVLEMEDQEGKSELLAGRKKLEGEGLEAKEDLTWWQRKTRYRLSERAAEERAKGRRVWLENRTLKVNGVPWRWNELDDEWEKC